jgi:transposase
MRKQELEKRRMMDGDTMVVGIDIGKYHHWVSVVVDGEEVSSFKIFHCGHGFRVLLDRVERLRQRYEKTKVVVGMEPTGHYWYALAYFLDRHKIPMVTVNPYHVKQLKELGDNSPLKSDPKDAWVVADLVVSGKYFSVILPKGVYAHLRKLGKMRDALVTKRAAHRNILLRILDVIFPEYAQCFSDVLGKTSVYLLRHYPGLDALVSLGVEHLAEILRSQSHRRLGAAKAKLLIEVASDSVGVTEFLESSLLELEQTLDTLELYTRQIADVEQQQAAYLSQVPYAEYLLSIPGVGAVTCATLLGEIGDFGRYRSADEVIKLAGLNLYEISSGMHKGRKRISKRGRSLLRKVLYHIVLSAIRCAEGFRERYAAMKARNVPSLKALVAMMTKMVRVMVALVKQEEMFSSEKVRVKAYPRKLVA